MIDETIAMFDRIAENEYKLAIEHIKLISIKIRNLEGLGRKGLANDVKSELSKVINNNHN